MRGVKTQGCLGKVLYYIGLRQTGRHLAQQGAPGLLGSLATLFGGSQKANEMDCEAGGLATCDV